MGDLIRRSARVKERDSLTASAVVVQPRHTSARNAYDWQNEAWQYYRDFGTIRYAIDWFCQSMSRLRLTAALSSPGGGDPVPLTEGSAVDLVRSFFGGNTGQSQYLRAMSRQLLVPGVGYIIAEQDERGLQHWSVRSAREIQSTSARVYVEGRYTTQVVWKVQEDEHAWRTLSPESYVIQQLYPDSEYSWRPDSPMRGLLRDLRAIDMLERRIVATAVSRLAANGILFYPQEVVFPPKPGFENAVDPFTEELLDIARKAIDNPGSAEAAIPLPVKVPKDMIQYFQRMDFSSALDERLVEQLEQRYERVATGLNMPKEVITGMGDTNHWSAWALDEQGVKVHIAPFAEMLCNDLTNAYLRPALVAAGESTYTDQGDIVVWYDASELILQPDRSAAADAAFDRQQIGPDAYLREKGFSLTDKPSTAELRDMLLLQLAKDPTSAPAAIKELTGTELEMPEPPAPEPPTDTQPAAPSETEPVQGPPPVPTGQ